MAINQAFHVTEEQVRFYQEHGYLIVEDVFTPEECDEINQRAAEIVVGKVPLAPGNEICLEPEAVERGLVNAANPSPEYLFKIGHRMHESDTVLRYYAMHEHIANVLESLIGPDIKCVQSMYIDKPKSLGVGQPYHQDSYYLKVSPDTLIAAWVACDDVDESNGCLRLIPDSQGEPIHPHDVPVDVKQRKYYLEVHSARERKEIACPMRKGTAVFFAGTVLHRSGNNDTPDRHRRAYVLHYASAKSTWVGNPNAKNPHLLVRGRQYPGCI